MHGRHRSRFLAPIALAVAIGAFAVVDASNKIRLGNVAARSVRHVRNYKQIMHSAVRRAIRIAYEPSFADRPVRRHERRDCISPAEYRSESYLWV